MSSFRILASSKKPTIRRLIVSFGVDPINSQSFFPPVLERPVVKLQKTIFPNITNLDSFFSIVLKRFTGRIIATTFNRISYAVKWMFRKVVNCSRKAPATFGVPYSQKVPKSIGYSSAIAFAFIQRFGIFIASRSAQNPKVREFFTNHWNRFASHTLNIEPQFIYE